MSQKMGLKSVTTEQGVSVTPLPLFWIGLCTLQVAWGNQLLLPQSSTELLHIWLIL